MSSISIDRADSSYCPTTFIFNPLAAAFTPLPIMEASTVKSLVDAFSHTTHKPRRSSLNPRATVFVPGTACHSGLNSLAAPLSPRLQTSQPFSLNPLALTFTPGKACHSALNPLGPVFGPTRITSPTIHHAEVTNEFTHQHSSEVSLLAGSSEKPVCKLPPAAVLKMSTMQECQTDVAMQDIESVNTVNLISDGAYIWADRESSPADIADHCPPHSTISNAQNTEYSRQASQLFQYPNIHHFNLMGQGAMCKTSTPPAVSLAVALSPIKACMVDMDNLRDSIILREAMLTIDPILYYGDLNQLKDLRGEELREVAIGATVPFYTPFGRWQDDVYYEDEDRPLTDELIETQLIPGATVVNGWLPNGGPTREEILARAGEAYTSMFQVVQKNIANRRLLGIGKSGLRTVTTFRDDGVTMTTTEIRIQLPSDASGLVTRRVLSVQKPEVLPSTSAAASKGAVNFRPVETSTKNCLDVNWAAHFGTGDWADDEEIGEAYLSNADTTEPVCANMEPMLTITTVLASAAVLGNDIQVATSEASTTETCCPCEKITGLIINPENTAQKIAELAKSPSRFRPCISHADKAPLELVMPIQIHEMLRPKSSEQIVASAPLPKIILPIHTLEPCTDTEVDEEEEEMYGSFASTSNIPAADSISRIPTPSVSSLVSLSPVSAADQSGALTSRSQEEVDKEDVYFCGRPVAAFEAGHASSIKTFELPFRSKPAMASVEAVVVNVPLSGWKLETCPSSCNGHFPDVLDLVEECHEFDGALNDGQQFTDEAGSLDGPTTAAEKTSHSPVQFLFNLPIRPKLVEQPVVGSVAESANLIGAEVKEEKEFETRIAESTAMPSFVLAFCPKSAEQPIGKSAIVSVDLVAAEINQKENLEESVSESTETPSFVLPFRPISIVEKIVESAAESPDSATANAVEEEELETSTVEMSPIETLASTACEEFANGLDDEPKSPIKPLVEFSGAQMAAPDSPKAILEKFKDDELLQVARLNLRKAGSPSKMRSVASDHTKMIKPSFFLVPPSMSATISGNPHLLDQIEEVGEDGPENRDSTTNFSLSVSDRNDAISQISEHFTSAEGEGLRVTNEEDEPVTLCSQLKESLAKDKPCCIIKSPFIHDLSAVVGETTHSEPVIPERSPVPSPYKRLTSNTPTTMLGKKFQFATPLGVEDDTSAEEIVRTTTGIGAIFEDEEEAEEADSILSGPIRPDHKALYLQFANAVRSFPVLPINERKSSSGSESDDVFSPPSTQTSAPTTADGNENGSPAPGVVPHKAIRPTPTPEYVAATTEKRKSRWVSMKGSLRKKTAATVAVTSAVGHTGTDHRRSSSWTKIENRLQKTQPINGIREEQTMKKRNFGGALQKTKNVFTKALHVFGTRKRPGFRA